MKIFALIFFAFLILPFIVASEMIVDISISENKIVREDISLSVDEEYDLIEFTTIQEPISVLYKGEYSIIQDGNFYTIEFPYRRQIDFSLIYDDMIDDHMGQKVFRTSFFPGQVDRTLVRVILPPHYVLSDKQPSAVPRPSSITTDGRRISLSWDIDGDADISVFYRGQDRDYSYLLFTVVFLIIITVVLFGLFRKKAEKKIHDTLSEEERKVMAEIRKGIEKQKEIARSLDFSKSKMSKIVRKLEEKHLISKEPYFKTNILRKI